MAYRLSVSVLSHASLASTLLRPVPSRPASLGRAIPSPRGAWAALPALAYLHLALCSLYCSPGFLGTVQYLPTCTWYLHVYLILPT